MKHPWKLPGLESLSEARLTVRRHVPWPLRVATLLLTAVAGFAGGAFTIQWLLQDESQSASFTREQLKAARERLSQLNEAHQQLQAQAHAADGKVKVAESAAARLTEEVARLEADNARLTSDLAYLERLLPAEISAETEVGIRGFEVSRPEPSGALRWRAMVTQSAKAKKPFRGTVQLVATLAGTGSTSVVWPEAGDAAAAAQSRLEFSRLRRLEGRLDLPSGATVRSVQLRVLEGESLRALASSTP